MPELTAEQSTMRRALNAAESLPCKYGTEQRAMVVASLIVNEGLSQVAAAISAVGADHPLMGETFEGLSDALREVAEAVREGSQ